MSAVKRKLLRVYFSLVFHLRKGPYWKVICSYKSHPLEQKSSFMTFLRKDNFCLKGQLFSGWTILKNCPLYLGIGRNSTELVKNRLIGLLLTQWTTFLPIDFFLKFIPFCKSHPLRVKSSKWNDLWEYDSTVTSTVKIGALAHCCCSYILQIFTKFQDV